MKKTKIYGDKLYGFHNRINGDVAVNLSLIWEQTRNEDKFAKLFSKMLIHEYLHQIVYDYGFHNPNNEFQEEKCLRLMVDYPFYKYEHKYYI